MNKKKRIRKDEPRVVSDKKCKNCGIKFRANTVYCSAECSLAGRQKHGGKKTRLYRIWRGMLTRCYNKKRKNYYRYGGAGISVCDAWHEFASFKEWALANGYTDEMTIDRKFSTKDYSPDNCRWTTQRNQRANSRRAIRKGTLATSKYRGVCTKNNKATEFFVCIENKKYGPFNSEDDAAKEYDRMAREAYGEFAYQNFPAD